MNEAAMSIVRLQPLLAATLVLGACVTGAPQSDPLLDAARAAVQRAQTDPNVIKFAALDLQIAENQLAAAERAAVHRKHAQLAQGAYLAAQDARLAQARAAAKADDARVAAGQAERDQIMLAARTGDTRHRRRE